MDLSRRHVAAGLTARPSIFTAGQAVVFPTKRPEFRGNRSGASAWLVSSLFTASDVTATAFVRIGRPIHPCEFGSDLIDDVRGTLFSKEGPHV